MDGFGWRWCVRFALMMQLSCNHEAHIIPDTNLFLWDTFHWQKESGPSTAPVVRLETEPRRNILALAFSASGDHIYSVGTSSKLVEYDISRVASGKKQGHILGATGHPTIESLATLDFGQGISLDHLREYDGTLYSVSAHPTHPSLVMTAGEEGLVRLHDVRTPGTRMPSMEGLLVRNSEINDAQWCPSPSASHSFVVAQQDGNVCLMDSRTAFSTSINPNVDPKNVIQRYATWISKPGSISCCAPEPSSVAFSSDGTRMAVTLKGFTPLLYDTFDIFPLAQFSATSGAGAGTPRTGSYANNCTIKHGSFGGSGMGLPEDSIYCAGSDDFRVYAWAIPPTDVLKRATRYYARDLWLAETGGSIACTSPDALQCLASPCDLSQTFFRLGEHRSIVNTAAFHPSLPFVLTSGVESHIQVHAIRPIPGGRFSESAERTRTLPESSVLSRLNFRVNAHGLDHLSFEEIELYRTIPRDDRPILLFDELLHLEGAPDIFQTRPVMSLLDNID